MMSQKKHIDNEQAATVQEHFDTLMDDQSFVDVASTSLTVTDLPVWYDKELFTIGQRYYQRNLLAMLDISLLGLLAGMIIPTILKVLVWTKQSGTPCTAFKRYLQTILHVNNLYTTDIHDPNSRWWESLNTMRWKHRINSKRSGSAGVGEIFQRDMAMSQFGFFGYALLFPEKFGLSNEAEGREGINHFWRIVGNALGIPDKLNICRKNEKETTALCRQLQEKVYVKCMEDEPEKFESMACALFGGLKCANPTLDADSLLYFWYNLSGLQYKKPLGLYSRLNYYYRRGIFYLFGIPTLGCIVRISFNYIVKFFFWIAVKSPIIAWIRFGKSNSIINLYPLSKIEANHPAAVTSF